ITPCAIAYDQRRAIAERRTARYAARSIGTMLDAGNDCRSDHGACVARPHERLYTTAVCMPARNVTHVLGSTVGSHAWCPARRSNPECWTLGPPHHRVR